MRLKPTFLMCALLAVSVGKSSAYDLTFDVSAGAPETYTNNFADLTSSNLHIFKTGAGTLTMQRVGDQVVTGSTTIEAGTVVLSRPPGLNNVNLPNGTIDLKSGTTLINSSANQIGDLTTIAVSNATVTFNASEYLGGITTRSNSLINGTSTIVLNGTQTAGLNAVGGGNAGVFSANLAMASDYADATANNPRTGNGTTPIFVDSGTSLTISGKLVDGLESSPIGSMSKSGAGTLILNGNSEYRGTTTITGGTVQMNGTNRAYFWNGSAMVYSNSGAVTVANANLVANGTLTGATTIQSGGTLSGSGSVGGLIVNSGGTISPGNSPGNLTVAGNLVWNGGGNYNWQVLDTTGTPGTTWDLITVTGALDLTALQPGSKFNLNLWSLVSATPDVNGNIAGFNPTNSYEWLAVSASNITGFNAAHFAVNVGAINGTGGFSNSLDSGYAFGVRQAGGDLYVTYGQAAPIPEPGTWAAMAIFAGGAAYAGWRRRQRAKVA